MTLEQFLSENNQKAAAFAAQIGVPASTVTRWLKGERRVSAEKAVAIEAATRGIVQRQHLRPDLWPSPEEAA